MNDQTTKILDELKSIRKRIDCTKEDVVDVDRNLTGREEKLIYNSFKNEKEGQLISLKELKSTRDCL